MGQPTFALGPSTSAGRKSRSQAEPNQGKPDRAVGVTPMAVGFPGVRPCSRFAGAVSAAPGHGWPRLRREVYLTAAEALVNAISHLRHAAPAEGDTVEGMSQVSQ